MKHLTVDEIIDFVSLNELNSEAIRISSIVNEHIRDCEECLNLVRSFQLIYDECLNLNLSIEFRKYIHDIYGTGAVKDDTLEASFSEPELER